MKDKMIEMTTTAFYPMLVVGNAQHFYLWMASISKTGVDITSIQWLPVHEDKEQLPPTQATIVFENGDCIPFEMILPEDSGKQA
jgi:hypothetical protein